MIENYCLNKSNRKYVQNYKRNMKKLIPLNKMAHSRDTGT